MNMPAADAISAARNLVAIPPVPLAEPGPRLDESTGSFVNNGTHGQSIELGLLRSFKELMDLTKSILEA